MKKNLPFIDITKFIFAIGILGIHSLLFESDKTSIWLILHCILRLGVPFFFCSSGFFLYRSLKKNNNTQEVVTKYLKRLLIPFIFWTILNLPVVAYRYHLAGLSTILIIHKIIQGIIFYPWGAMWYLLALIVSIPLIIPFYKKNKLKYIVFIGAILYLFALLGNTYYFVIEGTKFQVVIDTVLKIMTSTRNGLFEGVYFVSVGMLISEMDYNKKLSIKKNNILFIIFYILLIVEVLLTKNYTHKDDHSLFIMFIPLIPSLFILLGSININKDTTIFRNYSTGIYFSHRFVLGILTLYISATESLLVFFITFIIVFISLTILYKIDNKKINLLIK